MLCKLGGKAGNEADIKSVLEAAGVTEVSDEKIAAVVGEDVDALLASGMERLKDVSMGGGGGGGGGGGAAGASGEGAAAVEEKEEEEEAEIGGGMDMFGGDGGGGDY